MEQLTIGQVAERSGVGVETVRFYERRGLLNKPPRNVAPTPDRYPYAGRVDVLNVNGWHTIVASR